MGALNGGVLACVFVKLILDFRAARNLDHRVDDLWCCLADLQIMPARRFIEPAQSTLDDDLPANKLQSFRWRARTKGGMLSSSHGVPSVRASRDIAQSKMLPKQARRTAMNC